MARSLGFGSTARDWTPCSDSVSLRLRDSHPLTSPHTVTRRLILQKARHHPLGLWPLAGPRFQVLFHSPPGVLFTFPSRYYALSVAAEYSALEGGPPCFRQDFSCPAVLRKCGHAAAGVSRTGLSPAPAGLPRSVPLRLRFLTARVTPAAPLQPRAPEGARFGLLPVRSPLLGESRLISTPAGT